MRFIACWISMVFTAGLVMGCQWPAQHAPISSKALPPSYLTVKGFKQCLKTQSMGSWSAWCMPKQKPADCLSSSWNELEKITARGGLTACRTAV
jgi:hypothetical protein